MKAARLRIEELEESVEKKFKMDGRRKLEWFLGMQISENKDCLTLDQKTYIETVIEKFSMLESKPSKTPAEKNLKLVKAIEDEQSLDPTLYRAW